MSTLDKVLDDYSAKVFKNRKAHLIEIKDDTQEITANARTIPGIMTNRGCCYAGCKGVVLGPLKDVAIITHGPIGCGFYSWGTRRHKGKGDENTQNFLEYCFSTDMQESDIVFGGEKKLRQAIKEVVEIFNPKSVMICSTCPVGLIGDDIHAVAAESEKLYGIKVLAFSCEGYKGVSQSAGHHIANNGLIKNVIGTGNYVPKKYAINILGEYNIGGDGWEISRVLKKIGYDIVSVMTGDGSFEELKNAHVADLNVVQCHRSINYIGEMLKTKYGTSWIKVNFIGVKSTIKSLRDMAKFFGDPELIQRTEEVIAEEIEDIKDDMDYYKEKLMGRTAALFVGGSRSHHYQKLLKDLGMSVVLAGYEFAHRDDYEGREVLPSIKIDADSKNIEELKVEKDEKKFKVYLSEKQYEELKKEIPLDYYEGMMKEMDKGSVVVDDLNHYETEEFLKLLKPDIFFSGIKDKFVAQKGGILSRQLHSYDYSGPYAGFKGAVNFAKDIAMGIYTPAWNYTIAPWKTEPTLEGTVGGEA
ncbi:nitrogenase molybdenum-iron protein alpha chain [Clostridium sp. 'White wine YQ']|uniref:nitrogenase molybdenum-iron protein alpha chain n=1 Tax=Clostridium sp. 'White wine YQ' TaxID=3027474 RepID=UPI002365DBCE|nr:nitrogenase molybdenum-iron protein alpha chain [Clostridium sp. 'White wine YQ']MDD7795630.1 nitrogenase molybdenum-iron protein alpha chain [Clostridium sp. 'White wine YQ']